MEPLQSRSGSVVLTTAIAVLVSVGTTFYLLDDQKVEVSLSENLTGSIFANNQQIQDTTIASESGIHPENTYYLYFSRQSDPSDSCGISYPVTRGGMLDGRGREATVLLELLNGPSAAEKQNGISSFFSEKTVGVLENITVKGSVAYVNFSAIGTMMSAKEVSCAKKGLQTAVEKTLKQFGTLSDIRFQLKGSSIAFDRWIGSGK